MESKELLELMRSRRSIRSYADKPVPQEYLDTILEAASFAPTSRNRKPCKFITVTDRTLLEKLAQTKPNTAEFTARAGAVIVATADSSISDIWVEDSSIALTYMMLAAEALGLACCWVQMHQRFNSDGINAEECVRRILNLSENYRVTAFLSLGVKKTPDDSN